MQKVSIVIPAYNEEKYIGRLLASLQKLHQENILEILVIDNGSTDKTKEMVGIASMSADGSVSKIRLVEESKKGVAFARARAAQEAKGEIIAFLDADTYVSDKWLAKLLETFSSKNSSKNIVCISGPTYYYDMSKISQFSARTYWLFAEFFVSKITGYMGIFSNMAIRAENLKKIGGIDTSVEFYGDDTNITRRLSKVGKVFFTRKFAIYASARRFNEEGLFSTTWKYVINFFSEVFIHKPITKGHTEIR